MKTSRVLALEALLVCGTAVLPGLAESETGLPAVWIPHDLVVSLHDLPKRYSCDELWYKFHDVLLALGARPNMSILAYRCEATLGAQARSPNVELKFDLPREVQGSQKRWADVSVVSRTVRIAPGDPPSIDGQDCVLLSQIKSTLLDSLPVRVIASDLACQAPQRARARFGISAQALTPIDTEHQRIAIQDAGRAPSESEQS
jgi:hypothetical protein